MILKILKYTALFAVILLMLLSAYLFTVPLYRRIFTYPRMEKEVTEFQKLRKDPAVNAGMNLYRGVLHVHSYLSHDSEGTLADIIPAGKKNNLDFIFLTDHPRYNKDTLPKGYHGFYENVLIVPGSEKQGFDAWPLRPAIIDWTRDKDSVAEDIVMGGGIIFYAHPEEEHNWGSRWFQGMEIYNFHADTKGESLIPVIANFVINGRKYPQWSLREVFDEQTTILSRWDSLNRFRRIVGFSAVDTHENQNLRARFLRDGRLEWVGPDAKIIDTTDVSIWNRWLLHEPDSSGWVLKWMIDTYEEGFNYITNYLFADTLTLESVACNIRKGHLYTAFKSLGDAGGFLFSCTGQDGEMCGIMGDSVALEKVSSIDAVSPLPGQFRLLHNGKCVTSPPESSYQLRWDEMIEKGAYRVEVRIRINGTDYPWIYSNPIYVY